MCTIEEKDVLLEYIADTAGMVLTGGSGKYSPAEPAMLAQIRDRFYATDCSELDFTEEFNQLTELRKKYRNNQEQLQHSPEQYKRYGPLFQQTAGRWTDPHFTFPADSRVRENPEPSSGRSSWKTAIC